MITAIPGEVPPCWLCGSTSAGVEIYHVRARIVCACCKSSLRCSVCGPNGTVEIEGDEAVCQRCGERVAITEAAAAIARVLSP